MKCWISNKFSICPTFDQFGKQNFTLTKGTDMQIKNYRKCLFTREVCYILKRLAADSLIIAFFIKKAMFVE